MAKKTATLKKAGSQPAVKAKKTSIDPRWHPYLIVGFYALAVVILFRDFIFSDKMLFGQDTFQAGIFFRNFYVSFVKTYHTLPLWNPYIFGGMPFIDAFHGDILYPLSFFKFIMPLERALGWVLLFHIFLAGNFMYLCGRQFGLSRFAAFFSGTVYMLATFLISLVHPGHDGKIYVTTLFPLGMLFLERGFEKGRFVFFVWFGVVVAFIILTPHPQMAYFSLWAFGAYTIYRMLLRWVDTRKILLVILPGIWAAFAIVLALGLSAIQFYPGYLYVKNYSPRAEGTKDFNWATSWSLHPEELVSQIIPEFSGQYHGSGKNDYWGRNPFKDNSEYCGLIPLILAGIALAGVRKRQVWFFFGLGLFALIYALGATTPFFHLFYAVIPNIRNMRAPSMIMFLFSFCSALLAGFGVQELWRRSALNNPEQSKRLLKVLWILAAIFGALALIITLLGSGFASFWRSICWTEMPPARYAVLEQNMPRITFGFWLGAFLFTATNLLIGRSVKGLLKPITVGWLIFAFAVIDLWRMAPRFIFIVDKEAVIARHSVIDFFLQDNSEPFRVYMRDDNFTRSYLPYFGIETVMGYHGNQLRWYDDYAKALESSAKGLNLLNLVNAKYVMVPQGQILPEATGLTGFTRVFEQSGVAVYRNNGYLPRAFLVHQFEVIQNRDKILPRLNENDFNYRNSIILEENPGVDVFPLDTFAVSPVPGRIKVLEDSINSYVVEAEVKKPGFLFISNTYYPAWRAYEGAKELKIFRANYAFKAVYLKPGQHTIRFVYDSPVNRKAKLLTGLSGLFTVAIIFGDQVFKRARKKSNPKNKESGLR